jgi:hypothetical protein
MRTLVFHLPVRVGLDHHGNAFHEVSDRICRGED